MPQQNAAICQSINIQRCCYLYIYCSNKIYNMSRDNYLQVGFPQHQHQHHYNRYIPLQNIQSLNPQSLLKNQVYPTEYMSHTNPMSHHKHCLISKPTNLDKTMPTNQAWVNSQSEIVRDRVKSLSSTENNNKNKGKYQYLAFKQQQYRLQNTINGDVKEKQANFSKPELSLQQNNRLLKEQSNHFRSEKMALMEENKSLQEKNRVLTVENRVLKEASTKSKEENQLLKGQIQKLKSQIILKQDIMVMNARKLFDLSERINSLSVDLNRGNGLEMQYNNLQTKCNFLESKCNHLQQEKEYYTNLSLQHREMVQKCSQLQGILQHKDNYLQDTIRVKNQEYNSMVCSKTNQIKQLQDRINILERENQRICRESRDMQNGREAIIDNDKFIKTAGQFQVKIGLAVQQSNRLKNYINNLQGKIEQLKTQKASLQITLNAFEQRDRTNKPSTLTSQLQLLHSKLEKDQQSYDMQVSKYQLEILKLQNIILTKRYETTESLLDFYDQERLHEALWNALAEIQRLKGRAQGRK